MNKKTIKIFLFLSVGVYLVSLTQKTFCTPGTCEYFSGILNLIFGSLGVFMFHFPAFPWLANPILFASWSLLYRGKTKRSFQLSIIAFMLMLSFLLVDEIIDNEGGTNAKVLSYQLGYWLWLMSSFIILIGNIFILKGRK